MASSPSSPLVVPRTIMRRNSSSPSVHTIPSSTRVSGRMSMDSYDHAHYPRPASTPYSGLSSSAPAKSSIPAKKSGHKKSSSSPSSLLTPPLPPTSIHSASSLFSTTPPTPSLTSLASIPSVVLESEVEPLDLLQTRSPHVASEDSFTTPLTSSFFFGKAAGSASNTPMATPPASPALRAASANPSVSPSPSTTPPSSPSPSFLATWHGRLPTIPRPSPMMPFRAAKKVVTSVTSVGTGLLPSKEQLGSIPVAGRILKHPVMDSTLTYIASKTTHRGGKGGAESKIISPEDVHYRKLNKKLVEQSVTLAALAIEHEEESKAIDDEAGDDAFELYLAAIATLMHALPIETCDPLRREAFNSQLKSFLQETELDSADEDVDTKQLRRRRRRRHREYHDQASSLIHQYSSTLSHNNSTHNNSGIVGAAPGQPQYGAEKNRRRARARKAGRRNDGRCYGKHTIEEGPTLGETIISTAVESAIRLKQSPIPDAIKTCFHASKVVFNKVDEKFRLQERAWQLSKQSIEKAIELDEQYAIHEVVTETFFAAVTGLVKAGIAYKETPSYSTVKALSSQQKQLTQPPQDAMYAAVPERPHSPQAVVKKKSTSVSSSSSSRKKRISIIAEEEEAHALKEFGSHGPSSSSSSSSLRFTTSDEDDTESDDEFEEHQSSREPFDLGRRQSLLSTASSALPAEYKKQVQQKLGLAMALRGIASLILGNAALAK